MTDYLEQLLDNTAALLERVRKLENSRPAPEQGNGSLSASGTEERTVDRRESEDASERAQYAAQQAETGRKAVSGEGKSDSLRAQQNSGQEREDFREGFSPLLEQLERLERAQAALEGGGAVAGGRPAPAGAARTDYPLSLAGPGRRTAAPVTEELLGWSETQRGLPGRETDLGGALDWTEQADRIFRRDSRRYDGGFYLY